MSRNNYGPHQHCAGKTKGEKVLSAAASLARGVLMLAMHRHV